MKNITLVCEAKLQLEPNANEAINSLGTIEARVTTWGAREGADGRKFNYQPEGFADWAKEFADVGKPMPMFLNHNDLGMPVGQWESVTFDDEGMTANGRLFIETTVGMDMYKVLKESPNLFGGVSVGAYADEACYVDAEGIMIDPASEGDDAYFQITKGGLREVSIVMYPNNLEASIQTLEYFDDEGKTNPRAIEMVLRDAGLSKKDATTASSILKKVLEQRDATKPIQKAPAQSDSDAVVNEADLIIAALEARELMKALSKRI